MQDQNELQRKVDMRLKVMRILWFALLMSVALYFLMGWLTGAAAVNPNPALSLGVLVGGLMSVVASILIKWKLLSQAIEQHNPAQVQTAYVLALALCEVPALLGMLDHFVTGNRYYYVLFIVAVCGQLYHFPRRQHVLDASYKGSGF